jgi:hypothetical protein
VVGIVGSREAAEPGESPGRLAAMPKVRFRHASIRVVLAMVLSIAALAGCNSAMSVPLPGTGPLVAVSTRGGMCPAGACDQWVILERDGRVHAAAKPPNDLGRVPADVMTTLTAAVQATDYAALRSHPFTGECPVNVDGQELIFEFGAGAGTQRIASCEVDIDWGHPLFVAVGAALGAWVSMPVT